MTRGYIRDWGCEEKSYVESREGCESLAQAEGAAQRLFDPLGNVVGNTNGSRWEHRRSDIRNIAIMTSRIIGFVSWFSLEIMGIFMDFGDLRPHLKN